MNGPSDPNACSGAGAEAIPPPLWGGLLVGGGSRRMGAPKQLLTVGGVTLAGRAAAALEPYVAGLAVLGAGEVPAVLAARIRLEDAVLDAAARVEEAAGAASGAPSARPAGPLAGMLAAMRWRPEAAWVFAPCDLPAIEPAAVGWLLEQRRPVRWAVLPRTGEGAPPEPLLALYEPPARELLEELAVAPAAGRAPRRLADHPRVAVPVVPPELARCWLGVNTPAELRTFGEEPPAAGVDPASSADQS